MAFQEQLHPRAAGGKFGAKPGQGSPGAGEAAHFKAQLLTRAKQDMIQASRLRAEEHTLRAALAALKHPKVSKTTAVAKKSSKATPAGSKTGLAKKTPTAASKAATAKAKAAATSKTPATPTSAKAIQSRLIIVTGTIHALTQDATKCRQMAAQL